MKFLPKLTWPILGIAVLSVVLLGWGLSRGLYLPLTAGLVGLGFVSSRCVIGHPHDSVAETPLSVEQFESAITVQDPSNPEDTVSLVETMLAQGRCALLLRRQIIDNLDASQLERTLQMLDDSVAFIPAGEVVVGGIDEALEDGKIDQAELKKYGGRVVQIEPVFLDRYAVTNAQYAQFIHARGYSEMAIWEEAIWPAVLEFVDSTGQPGPRFWKLGTFDPAKKNHPVVGISWYEASAYARWVGKRLPTEAEWVKAGAWPVALSPDCWVQRRFPWGNSLDADRANIWRSGAGATTSADDFPAGASATGVQQMIGNVWEWISGAFIPDDPGLSLHLPMKSIRGGAFDTYFESQATCHFQSGDNPLNRKHNIGFRLALGACDLAPEALERVMASRTEKQLEGAPT